ncbi:MAG: hypothetical protein PHW87_07035 [Methanothrix sp.]|nr:hypothetical protein [Methanothrix sp.]
MKYVAILSALVVACLLAVPALAAQNGNCNGDCIRDCTKDCPYGNQDELGNQNGNGPNGNQSGDQDGSGPDRNQDGSCQD